MGFVTSGVKILQILEVSSWFSVHLMALWLCLQFVAGETRRWNHKIHRHSTVFNSRASDLIFFRKKLQKLFKIIEFHFLPLAVWQHSVKNSWNTTANHGELKRNHHSKPRRGNNFFQKCATMAALEELGTRLDGAGDALVVKIGSVSIILVVVVRVQQCNVAPTYS